MSSYLVTLSRYALAAWVGASVMFVMTSVAEVRSEDLSSVTKSTLALIRFPYFYSVGFTLMGIAACCEFMGGSQRSPLIRNVLRGLMVLIVTLMLADYFLIYTPLVEMTKMEARPANFIQYHHYSRWINTLTVTLVLVASVLANKTTPSDSKRTAEKIDSA